MNRTRVFYGLIVFTGLVLLLFCVCDEVPRGEPRATASPSVTTNPLVDPEPLNPQLGAIYPQEKGELRTICNVKWSPDGKAIPGASVYYDASDRHQQTTTCDQAGVALLKNPNLGSPVYAIAPGGVNLVGRSAPVGISDYHLSVLIPRPLTMIGTVLDEATGQPLDGAKIRVIPKLPLPKKVSTFVCGSKPYHEAYTIRGGFHIEGLLSTGFDGNPIDYTVIASGADHCASSRFSISGVPGATVTMDFRLAPRPTVHVVLRGRVLSSTGDPLPGATVSARATCRSSTGGMVRRQTEEVACGADAQFQLPLEALSGHIRPNGTIDGSIVLQVRAVGTPGIAIDVKDLSQALTIQLPAGRTVQGRVVDPDGRPVGTARIRAFMHDQSFPFLPDHPIATTVTDDGGWYVLTLDPTRSYMILADREGQTSLTAAQAVVQAYDPSAGAPPVIRLAESLESLMPDTGAGGK